MAEAAAALAAALATFAGSGVSVQVGAVYITVPKLGCTSRPLLYQSRCVEFKWPVHASSIWTLQGEPRSGPPAISMQGQTVKTRREEHLKHTHRQRPP